MSDLRFKNLIKYVVPTILSSVCFFMFTIVDGIFIGRGVGDNGLGAVNLVLPFVMIVDAGIMLVTTGGVTITAIRFGEGDVVGANQTFMHSVIGTCAAAVVLCLGGVLFAGPICTFLGASGTFHQMAAEYMFWYSVFIIPASLSTMLQGFCRNDGSPVLVSAAVIVSTVFNIFGDWLLVFPLQMGMKGAAIATGVSQTLALLIVLAHYLPKTKGRLCFHRPKFDPPLVHDIAVSGMPESISKLSTPVMTFCLNRVLIDMIGDIGVNAFSIISYVASFSMEIFMGTGEGLQPLIGQSYGMRHERDMKFYFRAGLLISFVGSIVINILLLFVGRGVCVLFGSDPETLEFTLEAMPKFAWGFSVTALNTMISTYLYSTKRSKQAITINVLRSLVINSLVIMLLPAVFGPEIIWFTFGIYELLVLAVAVFLLKRSERNGIVFY